MRPRFLDPIGPSMARAHTHVDPAADAAALLRRLGFAILTLALPLGALVSRRAVVVLAPIGIGLLVIAALLDGQNRSLSDTTRRLALSPGGAAGLLVLAWCALSLTWTPFFSAAAERLLSIVATIGMAVLGYLALPDRMRAANLYIVAVGVAVAALVAVAISLTEAATGTDDDGNLFRGSVVLVLFAWPAVAWMQSRGRDSGALAIAGAVVVAAVLAPDTMPAVALAVGAIVYAVTAARPQLGVRATALGIAGLLALSPLIPVLTRWIASVVLGSNHPIVLSLTVWRRIVLTEPVRLITGHGFETALRGRFAGLLPPNAPSTILFEVWYELGIVGALAGAFALYAAVRAAGRNHPVLVPGAMAAFASAFTFACLGIGTAQMWWFTALSILILTFVATDRGQFRTTRPKAILFPRLAANDR